MKVLLIYPHNFLDRNMGTNIRVYELAKELHNMGYIIDLYACLNMLSDFTSFERQNEEERLVNNLYLYDFNQTVAYRQKKTFKQRINQLWHREELDDWVTPVMIHQFKEIISATCYDYIVMFYVYTAELLSPVNYSGNARKVYFMEDFLAMGHYISGISKSIGQMLEDEMIRLGYFDKIACISFDEKIFFEKLLPNKDFYFLPHLISRKEQSHSQAKRQKKHVLFVGFDNPYNKEGIRWLIEEVYPFLQNNVEVKIVGKVGEFVTEILPNVQKMGYVEDLDALYRDTDIVVCPLKNGTGMKIKVIEAMSYGIPIVCTSRGVDGMPDKFKNGCLVEDTPKGFAQAINRLATDELFYYQCRKQLCEYFMDVLDWNVNQKIISRIFAK